LYFIGRFQVRRAKVMIHAKPMRRNTKHPGDPD
jgi:hypothetical protein